MGRRPAGHVPSYLSRGRWRRGRPGLGPRAAAVSGAPRGVRGALPCGPVELSVPFIIATQPATS